VDRRWRRSRNSSVVLLIMSASYRQARLMAFLHPDSDPQGAGFQLLQSLIAVGSGGFTGVGLMESKQEALYLPKRIRILLCSDLRGTRLYRRHHRHCSVRDLRLARSARGVFRAR